MHIIYYTYETIGTMTRNLVCGGLRCWYVHSINDDKYRKPNKIYIKAFKSSKAFKFKAFKAGG